MATEKYVIAIKMFDGKKKNHYSPGKVLGSYRELEFAQKAMGQETIRKAPGNKGIFFKGELVE